MKLYYDLHIHSCLSPCGDNDMTVNNIAGMGTLAGLQIMALTDHNSTKNLPAFFTACENYGIIALGGMELTTAEEVHMVCLFPTLESAMLFGKEVDAKRIRIKNKPEIFGEQLILDGEDNIVGTEEDLLINATTLTIDDGVALANEFGGVCFPAHIDRDSYGIIAMLGFIPEQPDFKTVEVYDKANLEALKETHSCLNNKNIIFCSDAHYLDKIRDKENFFEFDDGSTDDEVRKQIIEILKGNI